MNIQVRQQLLIRNIQYNNLINNNCYLISEREKYINQQYKKLLANNLKQSKKPARNVLSVVKPQLKTKKVKNIFIFHVFSF